MVRSFGIVCGLGLGLMLSGSPAFALGPVNVIDTSATERQDVLDASFFGRPYPYGFTGWGPCIRYVEVPSRRGIRVRRVNICR